MRRKILSPKTCGYAFGLLLAVLAIPAHARTIEVFINGQPEEARVPPIIQNGRTLVHIRETFEWLGATVWWNPTNQSIQAWRHEDEIWLQIGEKTARVNGQKVTLDQPPILYDIGKKRQATLVPLRFVSQALGANVKYDAAAHRVEISMPGFGTEAFYKRGDRVQYLQRHRWLPGEVLSVRTSAKDEPRYNVRVTEKSGRKFTVSVGREVLRRPR